MYLTGITSFSYIAIVNKLFGIFFILIFVSCGKEKLVDVAPSLIGTWTHYSGMDAWETLYIEESGDGTIKWYTNGKLFKDAKTKTWYVKDNTLYFGKATFSLTPYDIDEYPQMASSTEIINFDTLQMGFRYMKLDGLTFVEQL
jgi:hypothetical protein